MSKDDATWLKICYVAFAIIVFYITLKATSTLGIQTGWSEKFTDWYPIAANGVAVVVGLVVTWLLTKDKERNDYFLASIGELRKVSWPSMIDTRRMTIVVCVVVGIFSVILALFDLVWAKILNLLLA